MAEIGDLTGRQRYRVTFINGGNPILVLEVEYISVDMVDRHAEQVRRWRDGRIEDLSVTELRPLPVIHD